MQALSLELNLDTGKFTGRMQQAGRETAKFERNVAKLNTELKRTEHAADQASHKLRDAVLVMGNLRSAIENTRFFFTGLAESAITASAEIERTFHLLKGMSKADTSGGAIKEATDNLGFLIAKAKEAPFSIQSLSDTFVKFKAGGVDPMAGGFDALIDSVAAFGGSDEVLKRAAVAIQQMSGKGVVSLEELRQQLGEAVPTAINLMAEGMGTSYEKLVKEISLGKVRAEPALKAMFEQMEKVYGGSAQRMMETYQGKVAQLKTSLMELALAFTGMNLDGTTEAGSFFDTVKGAVEGITNTFNNPQFKQSVRDFGQSLGIAANAVSMMVSGLMQMASFVPVLGNLGLIVGGIALTMLAKLGGAGMDAVSKKFAAVKLEINGVIQKQVELDRVNRAAATAEMLAANGARDAMREKIVRTREAINERQNEVNMLRSQIALETQLLAVNARQAATGRNSSGRFLSAEAHQAAIRQEIEGKRRLAQLNAQLASSEALLNASQNRSIKLHTEAAAIQDRAAKATMAFSVAQRTANGFMIAGTVAARGLSMALAFFGGPIGLAIMAIGAAFAFVAGQSAKANAAITQGRQVMEELSVATANTEKKVENLTEAERDNEKASKDAAAAARDTANAYNDLAVTAANAAEQVKYLTDAQRAQRLEDLEEARTALQKEQTGGGLDWVQFDQQEKRNNAAMKLIREANGGGEAGRRAAQQWRYGGANQARILTEAVAKVQAEGRGGSSYDTLIEFRKEQGRYLQNSRDLARMGTQIEALQDSLGTETLTRPEAVDASTVTAPVSTPDGSDDKGKKGKDPNEAAKSLLQRMQEQTHELGLALTGSVKEADKINWLIAHDPKIKEASSSVHAQLRAAAVALDEAMAKKEGFEAFTKLEEELASSEKEAALLRQNLEAMIGGATGLTLEAMNYEASLQEGADKAKQFADNVDEIVRNAVRAKSEVDKLKDQVSAMSRITDILESQEDAIASAWDDYNAGIGMADGETRRFRRQLDAMQRGFEEGSEAYDAFKAKADAAMEGFHQERAVRGLEEMRQGVIAMNTELSYSSQRQRELATLELEAQRRWAVSVEHFKEGTQERQDAEAQYYAWKAAEEKRIAMSDPLMQMFGGWQDMMGNLSSAFADLTGQLIDGLIEGEMAFDEFAKNMLKQIAKIVLEAMIANMVLAALGLGGPVGSVDGKTKVPTKGVKVPTKHTGGIMGDQGSASRFVSGAMFANAMKYHTGGIAGLKPREVPAILQEGEGVFTKEQMANLAPVGSQVPPVVNIEIINQSGTAMDAQQQGGGPRFDGEEYIVGVVLDRMSKPGKMRDAMKGAMAG